MIEIELRDFRGCERASLRVDPIALVAGRNATGKSSIAQAIGAALTGDPLVVEGVAKGSAGVLVKTGASSATVTIAGPEGKARVEWPSCQVASDGKPPAASAMAAGLTSLVGISARERAAVVGVMLRADPTADDLRMACEDQGIGEVAEPIAKLIFDQGWDQAHSIRKDRGAQYKGQWRQVTGANYGSRIAAAWVPKGWRAADEKTTEADLITAVARAKAAHEQAIEAAAVSGAEREQLVTAAGLTAARQVALRDAETAVQAAATALDRATDARRLLPAAESDGGLPCPHCGAFVVIKRISLVETTLVAAETIPQAELKKRRNAIAEADGEISRLTGELRAKQQTSALAKRDLDSSIAARAQLDATPERVQSAGNIEAAREAAETAAARLLAFRQKHEADALRDKIAVNDQVLDILAPDGLRAKKLGRVLDAFSARLKSMTDAAGWKTVAIEADMALTYGGRPYALLSSSEQYRLRAVLQVAAAQFAGADLVVIDAADVLDGPTRSGLFQMLIAAGLSAVVCMTLTRREQVPDLAAVNLGMSYWIDDGILEPLNPPGKAEAA